MKRWNERGVTYVPPCRVNNHYADEVNGPICTTRCAPSFIPPSAHRLLFPFFSFGFFRPYSSSYIVCANVVNVPLSRRFGEQLTLLCRTLYFFTRHFDSLLDVFFCCQALECATSSSTIEFDSLLTVGGRIVWLLRAEVFDR